MDVIKFFALTQSMASLARYSQTRLVAPESVLQHSGFVALASYFITLEINSKAKNMNDELNIGQVLAHAIVHDLEESAVGDISRPTKYHSKETITMFHKLKTMAIRKVVKDLHLPPEVRSVVIQHHNEAKDGREGFIVDLADKMAVVYKMWDECLLRGNYTVVKHAVHLHGHGFLPALRETLQQLHFNPEQAFCLHGYLGNMDKLLAMVAAKQDDVHGIVEELTQEEERQQA